MKIPIRFALFMLLCVAQLGVPFTMIRQHEEILMEGARIKIRCQPIDPADPFRGRYVSLSLDLGEATVPKGVRAPEGPVTAYVRLVTDPEGFTRWGELSYERPLSGVYIRTTVNPYWSDDGETVWVEPPVDRFYLAEDIAPEAERVYFEHVREAPEHCYVTARVLEGDMVLEQLYLDDKPVAEYVREILDMPPDEVEVAPEGEMVELQAH